LATARLGPLHDGRSDKKEIYKLVNQLRELVNMIPILTVETLTTQATGALTVIWATKVPLTSSVKLTASVLGVRDDVSQSCAYTLECAVKNVGGVVTFVGGSQQVTFSREDNAAYDAQFVISGAIIGVEVQDGGVTVPPDNPTHWHVTMYAEQVGG
jgi:hypothetical protein